MLRPGESWMTSRRGLYFLPMPRLLVLVAVAAVAAAAWFGVQRLSPGARAADGPLVIISIDTLRADHLPIYGYTRVRTPSLDAFASQAVVFDRAYSHAPQTLPAHASIL